MIQDRLPLRPVLAIWTVSAVILLVFAWSHIQMLDGWDPDDRLRLVQLRDFLGGQSWFDTTQYRLNPPYGGPMHWNRLIEIPLALIVIPLTPLLGAEWAERIAAALIPLLCLGLIMTMLAHTAKKLASAAGQEALVKPAAYAAAALAVSASPALIQLLPMRVDHHGWQIVAAIFALWALGWTDHRKSGIATGASLAIWLAISIEGLPLALGFFTMLGLGWLLGYRPGIRLFWALGSFALLQPLLYLVTRGIAPAGGCDIIGPAHLGGALVGALILMAGVKSAKSFGYGSGPKLAFAAIALLCSGSAFYLIEPQCSTGTFSALDPLVREYWYLNVREGLPIWRQPLSQALSYIAGPLLGLIAFLLIVRTTPRTAQHTDLIEAGAMLFWSTLIALLVFRAVSVAAIFAIPFQAILAVTLYSRARTIERPSKRIMASFIIIPIILPGALVANLLRLAPDADTAAKVVAEQNSAACDNSDSLRSLSSLPTGNIIAPFDLGPGILLTTEHNVLASSHHRNDKAMHDQIEIFRQPPAVARHLIVAHKIDYIVSCPDEAEMQTYAHRHPAGLWARLNTDGRKPDWLISVKLEDSPLRIWKVQR